MRGYDGSGGGDDDADAQHARRQVNERLGSE